eukprot:51587_1
MGNENCVGHIDQKALERELLREKQVKLRPIIRQIIIDVSKYVNILKHKSFASIVYALAGYLGIFFNYRDKKMNFKKANEWIEKRFKEYQTNLIKYPPYLKVNDNGKASIKTDTTDRFEITITVQQKKFVYVLNNPTDKYHGVIVRVDNKQTYYCRIPNKQYQINYYKNHSSLNFYSKI